MIGSRRASLTIALPAAAASVLGVPLAHASSPMRVPGNRNANHPQEHVRLTNGHLPCNHQAHPRQHVEYPLADMILG